MAKVRITWNNADAAEDGVKIYRDSVAINPAALPAPIATLPAGREIYEDGQASPGTQHYYVAPFLDATVGDGAAQSIVAVEELPRFLYAKQQDGTTVTNGTTLPVTLPDCKAGDLLVLYGMRRSAFTSTPAGWTVGPAPANPLAGAGLQQWTFVLWKIADGSEPGTVVNLVQTSAGRLNAGVAVFRHPKGPITVTSLGAVRQPTGNPSAQPISYTNGAAPALVLSITSWGYAATSGYCEFNASNVARFAPALPYSNVPFDEPTQGQLRFALLLSEAAANEAVSSAITMNGENATDTRSDIHLALTV